MGDEGTAGAATTHLHRPPSASPREQRYRSPSHGCQHPAHLYDSPHTHTHGLLMLRCARVVVEDLNFYAEVFMEFLDGTINLLFKLLVGLKSIDSKLQVLNVISSLITQMEERVRPPLLLLFPHSI